MTAFYRFTLLFFWCITYLTSFSQAPVINYFTPTSAGTGDTIRIIGSNLQRTDFVSFGGVDATYFKAISDTEVKAVVGVNAIGFLIEPTNEVVIHNPAGLDTATGFLHKAPVVTSYSSANGCFEAGGTVIIRGRQFTGVTSVRLGSLPASSFTVVSDSLITAVANHHYAILKVGSPHGTYTRLMRPPGFLSLSHNTGKLGDTIFLRGINMCGATAVNFASTPAKSFRQISDSVVEVVVGQEGNGIVRLYANTGTNYTGPFLHQGPKVNFVTPDKGGAGTLVSLSGVSFSDVDSVKIGTQVITPFTVSGDTLITFIVGTGTEGAVKVFSPKGTGTGIYFNYGAPGVYRIEPNVAHPGDTVTLLGSNLNVVTAVTVGSVPAANFMIESPERLKVVVGTGSSGLILMYNSVASEVPAGEIVIVDTVDICPNGTGFIQSNVTGTDYVWWTNYPGGYGWEFILYEGPYTGIRSNTLQIHELNEVTRKALFRCSMNGKTSNTFVLRFKSTWTGAIDQNWENPGNWECGAVPTPDAEVVISTGTVKVNSNVTIKKLHLGAGANVTVTAGSNLQIIKSP